MATINGTAGNDTLDGTLEDDVINGLGGDDSITGQDGNDLISGGDGNDGLYGGLGSDTLNGDAGNDNLVGDAGNDTLNGGIGNDYLVGGAGNDTLNGGDGDDYLNDFEGANIFNGGAGADQINSNGSDTIDAGSGNDSLTLYGSGVRTITTGTGTDIINPYYYYSYATVTDFTAGNGGDLISLTQLLSGLPSYPGGNPFATGHLSLLQSGADTLVKVDYDGSAGSSNAPQLLFTLQNVTASSLTAFNFGGYNPDGSAVDPTPVGIAGTASGKSGQAITGTVSAFDPDSPTLTYAVATGPQHGTLTLNSNGTWTYTSNTGYVGTDTFAFTASDGTHVSQPVTETLTIDPLNTAPSITSDGGGANAAISLAENAAAVTTVQAKDPDAGTTIAYSITGGADAALFQINAATGALSFKTAPNFEAPVDAGASNVYDVVVTASDGSLADTQALAVTVTDVAEGNIVIGTKRADVLFGSALEDTLSGLAGNDVLDGRGGADRMLGGKGGDIYHVDNAGDAVVELLREGADIVIASVSYSLSANVERLALVHGVGAISGTGNELANLIEGNDSANVISGLAGDDEMLGGAGNDRLIGGQGKDLLTGGAGADTFVFDALIKGADQILDFQHGVDKVELSISAFSGLAGFGVGGLSAGELLLGKKALSSNDHLIYDSAKGVLLYDADGSGSTKAVQLAQFTKGLVLDAGDFILA